MTSDFHIWWKQITGPRRLTEAVARELISTHSVILITHPDLPWRQEMRYSIEDQIRNENLMVVHIDCKDDYTGNDIGRFLLERFASDSDQVAHRPHKESISQYLKAKNILANKVIWIKGIPEHMVEAWLLFCRDYKSEKRVHGLFVIEMSASEPLRHFPRQVSVIKYSDYITKYDTQLFGSIIVSQSNYPRFLHQYITFAVGNICITDGEVAAEMIRSIDFEKTDPLTSLEEIYNGDAFSSFRGSVQSTDDPHPFFLLRTHDLSALTHRLWKAQVQVAFPLVEEERVAFVRKYEDAINVCLPIRQLRFEIDDPYDVELGTLVYLTQDRDENDLRRLHISNLEDYRRLHFLRDMRNKLAHKSLCSPEEITSLLSLDGKY